MQTLVLLLLVFSYAQRQWAGIVSWQQSDQFYEVVGSVFELKGYY